MRLMVLLVILSINRRKSFHCQKWAQNDLVFFCFFVFFFSFFLTHLGPVSCRWRPRSSRRTCPCRPGTRGRRARRGRWACSSPACPRSRVPCTLAHRANCRPCYVGVAAGTAAGTRTAPSTLASLGRRSEKKKSNSNSQMQSWIMMDMMIQLTPVLSTQFVKKDST